MMDECIKSWLGTLNFWFKAFVSALHFSEQTHDSMYKFEQKVGLTETSYTPHKGLTAEETRHLHRMPDSFQVQIHADQRNMTQETCRYQDTAQRVITLWDKVSLYHNSPNPKKPSLLSQRINES